MPTAPADASRRIDTLLGRIEHLPTLSPIATRLLALTASDDAELDEIASLIESDPALTARILKLCRSSSSGLGTRIETVPRAVVMLGLEAVQNAVLSVCVYDLFDQLGQENDRRRAPIAYAGDGGSERQARGFDRVGFWKHAVAVACASELLASHSGGRVEPSEAYVAGLMHDAGKLVLDLLLPDSYGRVLELAEVRRCDSSAAEREVISVDHHTVGKRLSERWGLPSSMADVIWLHSQPMASVPDLPHRDLIGLVSAGRALARWLHLGWSGDFGPVPDPAEKCREAGLDPSASRQVEPALHESVAKRIEALGLEEPSTPELLLQSVSNANRRLATLNAALDARSRRASRQQRVLGALSDFYRDASGEPAARVVRSARAALGGAFHALAWQGPDGWRVVVIDRDGRVRRDVPVGPPTSGDEHPMTDASGSMHFATVGLLPWLGAELHDLVDLQRVRALPLATNGPVLLTDGDPASFGLDAKTLEPLTLAWSSAWNAVGERDALRRRGEELAQANRALAEAQRRLADAESMARLGEMTAGAAHELNNPLTILRGRSQMLAARLEREPDREAARSIEQAAEDMSDLISSLHRLAEPIVPDPRPSTPWRTIDLALEQASSRLGGFAGREPRVRTIGADREVAIDSEVVASALAELVINALQADESGGVDIHAQIVEPDGRLVFSVSDRGCGLSARAQKHAFDPFFSEKPAGRQTGLGLPRAQRLAEACGGGIRLAPQDEGGTVATLSVALVQDTTPGMDPGGAQDGAPSDAERHEPQPQHRLRIQPPHAHDSQPGHPSDRTKARPLRADVPPPPAA